MKRGIAVGGNITVDYVKTVDSYPKQDNLSTILSITYALGGALPNVLIDLSKMDNKIPLQAIGLVGKDKDGSHIIDILRQYNINTDLVKQNDSFGTSFSDVITVKDTGSRTFFHYRGTNQLLSINHFDFDRINADILHIGYALLLDALDAPDEEYEVVMARLLDKAQRHGLKTSLDVVSENSTRFAKIVPPSLKYCNYFIVNEIEASLTTGIPLRDNNDELIKGNIKDSLTKLMDLGVNELAVIHAPEGGYAMDKERNYYEQNSLSLPKGYIKGTVGAGDAFCAGILYSLYNEWSIKKALKLAVAAAASCLSEMNATDGMKNISEIVSLYKAMSGDDL